MKTVWLVCGVLFVLGFIWLGGIGVSVNSVTVEKTVSENQLSLPPDRH